MALPMNIAGEWFGQLEAISRADSRGRRTFWLFRCACGVEKEIDLSNVKSGRVISCGCYKRGMAAALLTGKRLKRWGKEPPAPAPVAVPAVRLVAVPAAVAFVEPEPADYVRPLELDYEDDMVSFDEFAERWGVDPQRLFEVMRDYKQYRQKPDAAALVIIKKRV